VWMSVDSAARALQYFATALLRYYIKHIHSIVCYMPVKPQVLLTCMKAYACCPPGCQQAQLQLALSRMHR
jgi:hypothetical protein